MTLRERLAELPWVAKICLIQAIVALFTAYDSLRAICATRKESAR